MRKRPGRWRGPRRRRGWPGRRWTASTCSFRPIEFGLPRTRTATGTARNCRGTGEGSGGGVAGSGLGPGGSAGASTTAWRNRIPATAKSGWSRRWPAGASGHPPAAWPTGPGRTGIPEGRGETRGVGAVRGHGRHPPDRTGPDPQRDRQRPFGEVRVWRAHESHRHALWILNPHGQARGPPDDYRDELARTLYFLASKRLVRWTVGRDGDASREAPGAGPHYYKSNECRGTAIAILETLSREHPHEPDYRFLLGLCYRLSEVDPRPHAAQPGLPAIAGPADPRRASSPVSRRCRLPL